MTEAFGVRFAVNDTTRFEALRSLLAEVKQDKDARRFREPAEWMRLVPDEVKGRFVWPTQAERDHWLAARDSTVIAIANPSEQLGSEWNFFAVFEAIENGDYELLDCVLVGDGEAEVQIDPHGYPYGGVGPFIALVEAFGFIVLGVNECGKYESRERMLPGETNEKKKPWWKFW